MTMQYPETDCSKAAQESKSVPPNHVSNMTLRDWFAGQALTGFLSAVAGFPSMEEVYDELTLDDHRMFHDHAASVARTMYDYADAMIAARSKP
jgi:hypothetical protein